MSPGDEPTGFPTAFLLAGCGAVIAANWSVEQNCARDFMLALMAAWADDNATIGDAMLTAYAHITVRRNRTRFIGRLSRCLAMTDCGSLGGDVNGHTGSNESDSFDAEPGVGGAEELYENRRAARWSRQVTDDEARTALQSIETTGDAARLRDAILSDQSSLDGANWTRSTLLFTAMKTDLRPHVEESVDDALQSSVKDFGLSTLIVLGAVLVLLKWRPARVTTKDGTSIEWKDNDVGAVETLAKLASGVPVSHS